MMRFGCKLATWLLLLLGGSGLVVPFAAAQQADSLRHDVRPLGEVLVAFQAATGIDLIYDTKLVDGKEVLSLREGDLIPELLLRRLLEGTGLALRRLESGTFVLEPAAPPPVAHLDGRVLDGATGEPLYGAHVLLADAGRGTATDAAGSFNFNALRPGRYLVRTSYLGYRPRLDTVQVTPAEPTRVHLALDPEPVVISPLIIEGLRLPLRPVSVSTEATTEPSATPAGLGTADVVRSLNSLMGVRVGDALADVHVQGGEAGEHQFRLDGVPIFEPVHLRGLLGAFNPFAIGQITVRKAGYGVAHGSQLAGLIEAEHTLASPDGSALDMQADPLSLNARLHLGAGGVDRPGPRLMLAARTSLWAWYQPPTLQNLLRAWNNPDAFLPRASILSLQDEDAQLGQAFAAFSDTLQFATVGDPDLAFNDLHAAARLPFGPRHRLYASFYRGWNRLSGNRLPLKYEGFLGDGAQNAGGLPTARDDYAWLNAGGQLRYTALFGPRAFLTARLRSSLYRLSHDYNTFDSEDDVYFVLTPDLQVKPVRLIDGVKPADDGNRISETALESTLDYTFGPRHHFEIGGEAVRMDHRFSIEDAYARSIAHAGAGWRFAAFAEEESQLGDRWTVTAGARLTLLSHRSEVYAEPRLAVQYGQTGGALTARVAAGLYRQFVNQFDVSSVSPSALLPSIRFWLPVDATLAPPKAYHVAADLLLRPAPAWSMRLETYYKRHPQLLLIDYPVLWERLRDDEAATRQSDFLRAGEGYAYGAAVGVEHQGEALRWSARYEHNMTWRTPVFASEKQYETAPWNEPHRLDLSLDWTPHPRLIATARGRGGWGRAWGFRQSYYAYLATDPLTDPQYGDYDLRDPAAHRLPAFVQVDLGAAYTYPLGEAATVQLRADLLNATDRANVADWSLRAVPMGEEVVHYERVERTLLPRTLSLALRLRW